jgi:branched-chain amino acid transport system ATP-binding protein
MTGDVILDVSDVSVAYAGVLALDKVSFTVTRNEIRGLIGPNGAGKTTFFNTLSRFVEPIGGQISCGGTALLSQPAHKVPTLGIARTFQNIALYDNLTVLENILLGGYWRTDHSLVRTVLRSRRFVREKSELLTDARHAMETLGISRLAQEFPCDLPLGLRKRIELARAVVSRPKLLCLDEPANGLTAQEVRDLNADVLTIHDEYSLAVLLVEHNMEMVMKLCDRVVVLDFGRVIADGSPVEIQQSEAVGIAYLGMPV